MVEEVKSEPLYYPNKDKHGRPLFVLHGHCGRPFFLQYQWRDSASERKRQKKQVKDAWPIHTWPQQATFHVIFDVHVLKLGLSSTFLTGVSLMISDYDVIIKNMYMVVVVTIQ